MRCSSVPRRSASRKRSAIPVPEGALFYGETRRRIAVTFDAGLRMLTARVAAEARAALLAGRHTRAGQDARLPAVLAA